MDEKTLKKIDLILAMITLISGVMTAIYVFPLYFPGKVWVTSAILTISYRIYYRRG